MLCIYCHSNDCSLNKKGKELQYCSKICQSNHTIEKRKITNLEKYGTENPMQLKSIQQKIKDTNLIRYGTETPLTLKSIQDKHKKTCLERYGVEHASQNIDIKKKMRIAWEGYNNNHPFSDPECREKREQTLLQNFGVKHPILNSDILQKIKDTNMERYGYENASCSPGIGQKISNSLQAIECKEQTANTNMERYGVPYFNQINIKNQLSLLQDPIWCNNSIQQLGITGTAQLINVSLDTVRKYVTLHNIIVDGRRSDFERQIETFITETRSDLTIESGNRSAIGKELDIYIPKLQLAVECDGVYWHSELNGKTQNYHITKTNLCQSVGIHLIHVLDIDWKNNRPIIESRLRSLLSATTKIHARKCTLSVVNREDSKKFLNANHIQGYAASFLNLGLYYNGILVSLMAFGKSRFSSKYHWELIRFCTILNYTVIGGASRLFSAFLKLESGSIVSYSAKDFNRGSLYRTLGFTKIHSSAPGYHYTRDYLVLENRIKYQKHKLKILFPESFDSGLTEWENMQLAGYDRIWNCGNDVWLYDGR